MSGGPVLRTDVNKVIGVTSQKYTFQDAGKAWRMTQAVIDKIVELRNAEG